MTAVLSCAMATAPLMACGGSSLDAQVDGGPATDARGTQQDGPSRTPDGRSSGLPTSDASASGADATSHDSGGGRDAGAPDTSDPADGSATSTGPRGAFVPAFGQPLTTTATLKGLLSSSNVDGFYLNYPWSAVEKTQGTFDFSALSADVAAAATAHKRVTISVSAGADAPAWLCTPTNMGGAGATCAAFIETPFAQPSKCVSYTEAVPWDATFQQAWTTLIAKLGLAVDSLPDRSPIAAIKLTGIDSDTAELDLPHGTGGAESCEDSSAACQDGTCENTNADALWSSLGYSPATLVNDAFVPILAAYMAAFPGTFIDLQLVGGKGFPAVGDASASVTADLLTKAEATLGLLVVVQNNGLDAIGGAAPLVSGAYPNAVVGYQMLQNVTNYGGSGGGLCVMAGPANEHTSPCNAAVLEEAVTQGLRSHASFLEIYSTDAANTDPSFQAVLACAHEQLMLSPATAARTCGDGGT